MKSRHLKLADKWRIGTRFALALLLSGSCGCAHLATVNTKPARISTSLPTEGHLASAKKFLDAAEHEKPVGALADDLVAAKVCYSELTLRPNDERVRYLYNFAVARAVENLERTNFQPWNKSTSIVTDKGNYILTSPKPRDSEHDPDRYDLVPTDTLRIGGKFFKNHSTIDGIGASLIAVGRAENPQFRQEYKLRRVYAPVSALIKFSGRKAELDFVDPFVSEQITLGNHLFPLAADFDASLAMLIARERPERIGFARVFDPEAYAATARLVQL